MSYTLERTYCKSVSQITEQSFGLSTSLSLEVKDQLPMKSYLNCIYFIISCEQLNKCFQEHIELNTGITRLALFTQFLFVMFSFVDVTFTFLLLKKTQFLSNYNVKLNVTLNLFLLMKYMPKVYLRTNAIFFTTMTALYWFCVVRFIV